MEGGRLCFRFVRSPVSGGSALALRSSSIGRRTATRRNVAEKTARRSIMNAQRLGKVHESLYGGRPYWQVMSGSGIEGAVAVLYPAYVYRAWLCVALMQFRSGRPHLYKGLKVQGFRQACFRTV